MDVRVRVIDDVDRVIADRLSLVDMRFFLDG